jgi:callose synthase
MAHEVYGILYSNVHPVSGATYQSAARDEESFLREVITPIYQVLLKVTTIVLSALVFATYIQVLF